MEEKEQRGRSEGRWIEKDTKTEEEKKESCKNNEENRCGKMLEWSIDRCWKRASGVDLVAGLPSITDLPTLLWND